MGAKARVLVVDNNRRTVIIIKHALKKQGCEVLTAFDGKEGLRKAREEKPDLVILDVMVPRMNGYEVCYRLKTDPDTAHIAVLMLTAEGEIDNDARHQFTDRLENQLQGLEIGTVDFLTKPIKARDLLRQVKTSLYRLSQRPVVEFRD